jgi:hypothetical protein
MFGFENHLSVSQKFMAFEITNSTLPSIGASNVFFLVRAGLKSCRMYTRRNGVYLYAELRRRDKLGNLSLAAALGLQLCQDTSHGLTIRLQSSQVTVDCKASAMLLIF